TLRDDIYPQVASASDGAIKLGLDLQGGMHLVLEVNLVELMHDLAKNKDASFDEIVSQVRSELEKNPDADFEQVVLNAFQTRDIPMARYFGDPRQSDREILRTLRKQADEAVNLTLTTLRNRVDEFGVSEPNITKQGARRIVVELPGIQDAARARRLIGRTALLEFKLVAQQEVTAKVLQDIDTFLSKKLKEEGAFTGQEKTTPITPLGTSDSTTTSTTQLFGESAGQDTAAASDLQQQLNEDRPFSGLMSLYQHEIVVPAVDRITVEQLLGRQDVKTVIPPEYEFAWSHVSFPGQDGRKYWRLYLLKSRAEITGSALTDAQLTIGGGSNPAQAGAPIVNLTMNREGARRFSRITESNIGRFLAIVLDSKVHMAPVLKTRIPDGRAIIEGAETVEEASDLAVVLRAGALPAPVEIIEERTVGPSLGADSIHAGTSSALIGFVLVVAFMIFYYRGSGIIADLALMLNVVFIMAVLAGFGFTLTLPGIAGVILTIGMAVDANVLIYERVREELRAGKTVWNAIKNGFDRAFVTILDANVTTLIAGVVLYQFGTGPIRGFALTLIIGIVSSMFTALVVSRAIFDWITHTWTIKKLSI
ncbi:MAG: protein translocase subunit SecD, partial [bacterium]